MIVTSDPANMDTCGHPQEAATTRGASGGASGGEGAARGSVM